MTSKRKTIKPLRPAESQGPPADRANASFGIEARPRRMLSEKQLLAIVPFGRSTLWRMEEAGKFPKPAPIDGTNRRYWFEDQIVAWQNGLNDASYEGRGKSK
ncbi:MULTISPECIES: AlpA family phage regulatory protein [unclassified Bradyrhizobium]|uniref:helix-turn-helix transcriptional regulator n=1 Tax=unclassified Bradyrhizobium TaxID=2631580 RepID=UPI0028E57BE9|nr:MULTISPECIES: AlpA family phage regulatory protein [unclassified Bradyrhizobium]